MTSSDTSQSDKPAAPKTPETIELTADAPATSPKESAEPSGAAAAEPKAPQEEASDEPLSAPPRAPERRKGSRIVTWLAIIVIAVLSGAVIALYALPRPAGPGAPNVAKLQSRIDALGAKLREANYEALANRVSALEKQPSAAASADLSDLTSRLGAAEQAIAALSAGITQIQQNPAMTLPNGVEISQQSLDNLNALATDLKDQIAGINSRLNADETTLKDANSALGNRIASLEQKIPANLTEQLANLASKGDLAGLGARVGALEANTSAIDAKRAAAAIALANLARAAQSGGGFTDELAAVRLLDVDPALIQPIAAYADKGVTPVSELSDEFDIMARDALRASRASTGNWWARLWANVQSLFLVRRTGPMQGKSDEAILARAGDAAHAGDLSGAVSELGQLSAPAAKIAAGWRREAQARADLDRLVTSLTAMLIASLAGPDHP